MNKEPKREELQREAIDDFVSLALYKVMDNDTIRYEATEEYEDGTTETMTFATHEKALNYFNRFMNMVR